jgi:hypothetical protein
MAFKRHDVVDGLLSLFEAARWAPSTYDEQEWRFLYQLGRRSPTATGGNR